MSPFLFCLCRTRMLAATFRNAGLGARVARSCGSGPPAMRLECRAIWLLHAHALRHVLYRATRLRASCVCPPFCSASAVLACSLQLSATRALEPGPPAVADTDLRRCGFNAEQSGFYTHMHCDMSSTGLLVGGQVGYVRVFVLPLPYLHTRCNFPQPEPWSQRRPQLRLRLLGVRNRAASIRLALLNRIQLQSPATSFHLTKHATMTRSAKHG